MYRAAVDTPVLKQHAVISQCHADLAVAQRGAEDLVVSPTTGCVLLVKGQELRAASEVQGVGLRRAQQLHEPQKCVVPAANQALVRKERILNAALTFEQSHDLCVIYGTEQRTAVNDVVKRGVSPSVRRVRRMGPASHARDRGALHFKQPLAFHFPLAGRSTPSRWGNLHLRPPSTPS